MGKGAQRRKAEKKRRAFNKETILARMNQLAADGKITFVNKDDPALQKLLNRTGADMASAAATQVLLDNVKG